MAKDLMLEAALRYRKQFKWSVIPLSAGSKVPPKGFSVIPYREKLPEFSEIIDWWTQWPNANIGIITGKLSNLFVVDIDTEEGHKNINQYIPDSLVTPTAETPRGGQHLYFKYPAGEKITIAAGAIPGSDYRGEGGYIVAAPSINGNGKAYSWTIPPEECKLADLPSELLRAYINNNNIYSINNNSLCVYGECNKPDDKLLQNVTINLNKGTRDQSLYHVAHTMIKGGASKEDTQYVLNLLAKHCNPIFPENEIITKCNSAIQRAERKERNLTKEVEEWILLQSCYMSVTSCYNELQVVTKEDKGAVRVALNRLTGSLIERVENKVGIYKKIETEFETINFDENEPIEFEYPVKLPLGLNDLAEISKGNIILVAGEFNAGKTSFLLNILKDNKDKQLMRYITSEMSKSEFKKRFATFGLPLSFWKQSDLTDYVKKSSDFHSAIRPDAINIIDYMEFRDSDYTKGAEYLTQIHDKLTTGIAIVAVQKKEGTRMPRSGDMIVEKPRLAISFTKSLVGSDYPQGTCEILKCKMPKVGKVDGKKLRFELQERGSKFFVLNDWGFWRGL